MIKCDSFEEVIKQDTIVWSQQSGFWFLRTKGDGKNFVGGPTIYSTDSELEGSAATLQGIIYDLAPTVCPGVNHFYVLE